MNVDRRLTTQDVTWFLDLNGVNRLDLEPAYQRRSVWTKRDRQYFLDTIFNNYPSPAVFLHKETDQSGNATYHVVDGKQRLETVLMFVTDNLRMSDQFGDARLDGKYWRELEEFPEIRKRLWDYQFTVEMLDSVEASVVNDVFSRLNQNSRKLLPQEIRHSRYDGWFISFVEQQAERSLWRTLRVSTAARARRMQDVQFLSELLLIILERDITGFSQESLSTAYALYDEPTGMEPVLEVEDIETRFDSIAAFLLVAEQEHQIISDFASNLAHFYSLWAWLALQPDLPDLAEFARLYSEFILASRKFTDASVEEGADVPPAHRYGANVRGASTDLGPRRARLEALTEALQSL